MDELERIQLIKSITLGGASHTDNISVSTRIANREQGKELLNLSSGLPSIKSHLRNKFNLILSQPLVLSTLSPLEIRCCLCSKVIAYPTWYYTVKYNVNEFHYFVCFGSADKVNARCYKR